MWVSQETEGKIDEFRLSQNYPNPFNPSTRIEYSLPVRSDVLLSILNVLGRVIAAPVSGVEEAGIHSVVWDAGNLPSGMYFYHLETFSADNRANLISRTRKLLLVK